MMPMIEGQATSMTLAQADTTVTGTWDRVATFVISDSGPVSGVVSGSSFNFTAQTVTEWKPRFPGDENNVCHIQTETFKGLLHGFVRATGFVSKSRDAMSKAVAFIKRVT